ncbi:sulfotransferase [Thalassotalea fonticola]|uniref:Sulfotransferase n=1 Tax=Thalassotalea fonticola TaxID=3065649 RepID=A0ABZ0GPQ4_9GAMM|nr:sulfotransferase [Colwelliaceae bacterium S1-1]
MSNSPNPAQNPYQKGLSLWQQKKANEAFQYFQKALNETDDKPFLLLSITQLLLDSGYFQQGIEVLNQYSTTTQVSSLLQVRLALLHDKMNASTSAISVLNDCIKKDPLCVEAYTLLAEIYGHSRQIDLAKTTLFSLLKQYPDDVEIHNSAASYLSVIGADSAALDAYALTIKRKCYTATTLSKIAKLHYSLGEFNEATRYNLLALSKDSNSAAAYQGIAVSKKFSTDDSEIIKKFTDALKAGVSAETKTVLNFSLGKINDDLHKYEQAFEYFKTANKQRKKMLTKPFDINSVKQQFEKLKSYFSEQQIKQLQQKTTNNYEPIFIVGMPRSGTTLLERIFSSNEKVFCAGELDTLDLFPKHIENSTGNKVTFPEVLSHIPERAVEYYCVQYLKSITTNYNDYQHTLDKNPLNFANIGFIKMLFPKAKIIHCTRNPVDICLSIYSQNFAHTNLDFSYDLNDIAEYHSLYSEMMRHWSYQDLDILTISYEDMVRDPKKVIDQLCEYTNLKQLSVESGEQNTASIHTASVWQARQKIYNNSIERWTCYKNQLSDFIHRYPELLK